MNSTLEEACEELMVTFMLAREKLLPPASSSSPLSYACLCPACAAATALSTTGNVWESETTSRLLALLRTKKSVQLDKVKRMSSLRRHRDAARRAKNKIEKIEKHVCAERMNFVTISCLCGKKRQKERGKKDGQNNWWWKDLKSNSSSSSYRKRRRREEKKEKAKEKERRIDNVCSVTSVAYSVALEAKWNVEHWTNERMKDESITIRRHEEGDEEGRRRRRREEKRKKINVRVTNWHSLAAPS